MELYWLDWAYSIYYNFVLYNNSYGIVSASVISKIICTWNLKNAEDHNFIIPSSFAFCMFDVKATWLTFQCCYALISLLKCISTRNNKTYDKRAQLCFLKNTEVFCSVVSKESSRNIYIKSLKEVYESMIFFFLRKGSMFLFAVSWN